MERPQYKDIINLDYTKAVFVDPSDDFGRTPDIVSEFPSEKFATQMKQRFGPGYTWFDEILLVTCPKSIYLDFDPERLTKSIGKSYDEIGYPPPDDVWENYYHLALNPRFWISVNRRLNNNGMVYILQQSCDADAEPDTIMDQLVRKLFKTPQYLAQYGFKFVSCGVPYYMKDEYFLSDDLIDKLTESHGRKAAENFAKQRKNLFQTYYTKYKSHHGDTIQKIRDLDQKDVHEIWNEFTETEDGQQPSAIDDSGQSPERYPKESRKFWLDVFLYP